LEETLTVQRLKLHHHLARVLSNTNIIENCFSQVAHRARRVKRWDGPQMILRWTASNSNKNGAQNLDSTTGPPSPSTKCPCVPAATSRGRSKDGQSPTNI
jgi:hypothetical protein